MEFLIILIIIIIIIFFISRSSKKRNIEIPVTITVNGKPIRGSSKSNDYEDPWDSEEQNIEDEIFISSNPMFFILQNHPDVYNYIENKYHKLVKILVEQKNEYVQQAIYNLLDQNNFKPLKSLPKYLQVVPVKSLISKDIFITAGVSDLPILLSSLTMDVLKELCIKKNIKPARSKKETIEKLLESDLTDIIDFKSYFSLNPDIKKIHEKYSKYCYSIIEKSLNDRKLRIKKITKRLDPDELNDEIRKEDYSIQNYGYHSVVFFKHNKPIFRIMGMSLDSYDNSVLLLENGFLAIIQHLRLDKSMISKILLVNENKEVLGEFKVRDFSNYELSEIEDKPFLFQQTLDDRYWILNYKTLEQKYLENPENLDIYTLIENNW